MQHYEQNLNIRTVLQQQNTTLWVAIKYSNVFKPDLHIENKEMIVAVNAIYAIA